MYVHIVSLHCFLLFLHRTIVVVKTTLTLHCHIIINGELTGTIKM